MTPAERPAGVRPLGAPGQMGVDYEERVDFGRLRGYRMARARAALEASECGAFLLFDFYNIRYTTQTWIGGALGDKMIRYALLFRDRDAILWDFGSAVRHHKLYSRWLPDENWRPGFLGFRGAVAPGAGLMRDAVTEIKSLLTGAGVADAPLGLDIVEPPFLFELERQGIAVRDAQQAIQFLRRAGGFGTAPRPGLILLDLNLPRRNGLEVLAVVKSDSELLPIPVVVLTTSGAREDILRSYSLHANAYITKPIDFDHFIDAVRQIDGFYLTLVALPR